MATKKRKKKFFDVEIPLIGKETQLQAYELSELEGKFMEYDLTRILRGKGMLLQLTVEIKDGKAIAIPRRIKLMPFFLRRMMRKGTNYIEDSFSTTCKDAQIRIKPFLISRKKVSRAVRKALREKAKEELIEYSKDKNSEDLFDEILKNHLQRSLSLKLKKIYPLSLCEIRIFKIEKILENKKTSNEENLKE
jgi:ribosomal protein S3AE